MKVNTLKNSNESVLSNVDNQPAKGFSLSIDNPQLFSILSDKLYENKAESIVRELSCNAVDAHIAAGNPDKPYLLELSGGKSMMHYYYDDNPDVVLNSQRYINLDLPVEYADANAQKKSYHHETPFFRIRDFGTGLSHDNVMDMYTSYGSSTKRHTNAFIGGFGIGSKSPFAYTDMFTVVSYFNGEKHTFMMSRENGFPTCTPISTTPTDEPNGLEISFLVDKDTWPDFNEAILKQHAASRVPPVLVGVIFPNADKAKTVHLNNVSLFSQGKIGKVLRANPAIRFARSTCNNEPLIRQGDVIYTHDNTPFRHTGKGRYFIDVPVGTFSPTASRERIENIGDNTLLFDQIMTAIFDQETQDCLAEITSRFKDYYDNVYNAPKTQKEFELHLSPYFENGTNQVTTDCNYLTMYLLKCAKELRDDYGTIIVNHVLKSTNDSFLCLWTNITGDKTFTEYHEIYRWVCQHGNVYGRGGDVPEHHMTPIGHAWNGKVTNITYTFTPHWLAVVENNARKASYFKSRQTKGLQVNVEGTNYIPLNYLRKELKLSDDVIRKGLNIKEDVAKASSVSVQYIDKNVFEVIHKPFLDRWGYNYLVLDDVPAWKVACDSLAYATSTGLGTLFSQVRGIRQSSSGRMSWDIVDRKGIKAWETILPKDKPVYYIRIDNSDKSNLIIRPEYKDFFAGISGYAKEQMFGTLDKYKPLVVTDANEKAFVSTFPVGINVVDLFIRMLDERMFCRMPEDVFKQELVRIDFSSRYAGESLWRTLQSSICGVTYQKTNDDGKRLVKSNYLINELTYAYNRNRLCDRVSRILSLPKTRQRIIDMFNLTGIPDYDLEEAVRTEVSNISVKVNTAQCVLDAVMPEFYGAKNKSLYISMASAYYGGAKELWRKLRTEYKTKNKQNNEPIF